LKGDKTISAQDGVSLPMIQRYVDKLLKGDIAPPIKMDGDVIVDGNHQYIAAKILGKVPEIVPGILTSDKASKKRPTVELEISPLDWDNR
jgi:filamentous hemagglutinin